MIFFLQSTDPSPSNIPILPLQMMTAAEETGWCVPLSELVIGVTTRRSPPLMMTVQNNGACAYVSELVTEVATRRCPPLMMAVQNNGACAYVSELVTEVATRRCPPLMMAVQNNGAWCGVPVTASSATLQHGTVHTNSSLPAPPLRLPSQTEGGD